MVASDEIPTSTGKRKTSQDWPARRSFAFLGGPPSLKLRLTRSRLRFGTTLQAKAGAGDEARTRDVHLGKVVLYQLSYTRSFKREQ
jgi:hypothetical protein